MPSLRSRISRLLLLPALALACSCAEQGAVAPPVADLSAVVEAKPQPTDDIATSQQAYDQYQASVESWGDRISSAGARLCRWSKSVYKVKVQCPK
jgi:hypothetical protein